MSYPSTSEMVHMETCARCWDKRGNTNQKAHKKSIIGLLYGVATGMRRSPRRRTAGDKSIYSKVEYE